jgi:DNA replication protein DnaC
MAKGLKISDDYDARNAALEKAQLLKRLSQDLGERYSQALASLESYRVGHKGQRVVIDRLNALAGQLEAFTGKGSGLIFYGPAGTGKDHLAAAMLYRAAGLGISARWVSGMELFGDFRDNMGDHSKGLREGEILERWTRPKVLCISDPIPPVGPPSPWNVQVLYRLIDRRYHLRRSTWATLNVVTAEDADAKLTAPVFDRLRHDAELIPCFWPSFRQER